MQLLGILIELRGAELWLYGYSYGYSYGYGYV